MYLHSPLAKWHHTNNTVYCHLYTRDIKFTGAIQNIQNMYFVVNNVGLCIFDIKTMIMSVQCNNCIFIICLKTPRCEADIKTVNMAVDSYIYFPNMKPNCHILFLLVVKMSFTHIMPDEIISNPILSDLQAIWKTLYHFCWGKCRIWKEHLPQLLQVNFSLVLSISSVSDHWNPPLYQFPYGYSPCRALLTFT